MDDQDNRILLQVKGIHLNFGAVKAINGVSMEVKEGEILAIIGPNGAGKTSMLNVINCVYHPQKGSITFQGRDITGMQPHQVAALGIARTFQNLALFSGMTVLENIMSGKDLHMKSNFFSQGFYWKLGQKRELENRDTVERIIDFLEINEIRKVPAGILPYGLQKRVGLGRALAMEPKILLLDEPMAGMNVEEKEDITRFIMDTNEELGITIVLIEHDMGVVMDISDRIVVLDYGQKIAEGTALEIRNDPKVIQAYLGTTDKATLES
jgi:branched-chain amino acid transport system ATP-binding protein